MGIPGFVILYGYCECWTLRSEGLKDLGLKGINGVQSIQV